MTSRKTEMTRGMKLAAMAVVVERAVVQGRKKSVRERSRE